MSIPKYIKTIPVETSCSRKGDFKIEGENAWCILKHLDGMPVVFSTEKDGYKIDIALVPKNNEIIGMIKIPKPADELCSDVSSNICCEIVGEKLQKAPLCVYFYDTVLEFTLNCPYAQKVQKKTWLCLDFGNTRTCALLDLPDEEIEFYDVRFLSRNPEENKGVDPKVPVSKGIIESLCATIDPSDGRHSFTVFGKEALWYNNTIDRNSGCKVMFSSPKRYFWDDKRDNRIVKAKGGSKSKSFENKEKSDFEKKLLGETDHCSPMHVFQSSIIELLEQAEATLKLKEKILDNKTEMEKSDILEDLKDLDYVTNLVFACPAAWTVHERAVYSEVVRKACEIYNTRAIAGCRKFEAELSCDEATAVLMYYVKQKLESGEQDGNNMASWIYRNGKPGNDELSSKMRCRIGVIDVGGGTSDLSIAEMRINKVNGVERVNVESLYSNGTHDAGDKLLRNIIRKILFDRVFDSLFTQDGLEFFMKEKDHAAKQYLQEKLKALVQTQKFTRSFWFQLAIKAVECMGKEENIELKAGELLNVYDEILMAFREDVAKDDDIKKTGFECAWINDAAELTISLKDLQKEYKEVIEETFSATASLFGSALLVYDCDLLLFSGKTMEIKPVREFFNKYLSIPIASLEGHDLKKATAIGAEYFVRKNDVEMNLGIEVTNYKSNEDEQFYWLVKSNRGEKSFTRDECITLDSCNQSEIFIYREKFKGNRDFRTPSYKLKLKDCQGHKNSDRYTVKLQYDQNDKDKKLQIQSIKDLNSEEECKDKWELSICMFGNADEQSWLDTGKIFE